MEFTDWMLIKLGALAVLAFAYNFWRTATGRKPPKGQQDRRDR